MVWGKSIPKIKKKKKKLPDAFNLDSFDTCAIHEKAGECVQF
jgi:hypothetical protein